MIRIIPRLDIKGPNLVKGIQLEGLRVLGKPSNFANYYYKDGADEIIYMDVVASLYERNSLNNIISETASKIFVPLSVGGGLRNLYDIENVLKSGADKVIINTAAVKNQKFIGQAVKEFGSSTIAVSIEVIKQTDNSFQVFTDNGREYTGLDGFEWSKEIEQQGAGELIITSVDKEGTGKGFEIEFLNKVSINTKIPLIAHGGAGRKEDVLELLQKVNLNGVSIGSIFHYNFIQQKNYSFEISDEGNTDFISNAKINPSLSTINISSLKTYLKENNIKIRG